MNDPRNTTVRADQQGYVMEITVRVVLLLLIFGMTVFLASRYRTRVDLTADSLYTLTDSTRKVLANLDKRLVIEAYFSRDDKLGTPFQEQRRVLDNFLDELIQLSDGRIRVEKLDPSEDSDIRAQAERLGIQPVPLQDVGDSSLAVHQVWQGVRMLYGGERQEVIPLLQFAQFPTQYEMHFTPKIKALSVEEKPVIGLLAYATEAGPGGPMGGRAQSFGYNELGNYVKGRYELQTVDLGAGQLVPDHMDTLMVVRPKNLTDRQKFALDQFLMRGGKLVVFADTVEVQVGNQRMRTFRSQKVSYDAPDSEHSFLDQLAHYGAAVEEKVLADCAPQTRTTEPFMVIRQTIFGPQPQPLDFYPYWFHAEPIQYADFADELAQAQPGGDPAALAEKYRNTFKRGVDPDNLMFKAMVRGPGMFWPCPVELADEIPDGVTGTVLLRTSPYAFAEDPPPNFNPLGGGFRAQVQQAYEQFRHKLVTKLNSEPRQQYGLMVELEGTFGSFFDGKSIPPRNAEQKPASPVAPALPIPDPLAAPVQVDPTEKPSGSDKGQGGDGGYQDPPEQDPENTEAAAPSEGEEAEAEEQDPEVQGPAAPEPEGESEPDTILRAPASAKLIVIGDADFLRDDLRPVGNFQSAQYQNLGPVSMFGPQFFTNLVDWLAEDEDLLELRNQTPRDRQIKFAEDDLATSGDDFRATIKAREKALTFLNVGGPFIAIMVIWLVFALRRRAQKQAFLASVQD